MTNPGVFPWRISTWQPNLHNDAKHLPPHLDFPMHDGFGVVIVTIQMAGPQSVIALLKGADSDFDVTVEKEKERCWTFSLNVGDCYILSGDARNVCDHGVLCVGGGRRSHKVDAARESLNLSLGCTAAFAGGGAGSFPRSLPHCRRRRRRNESAGVGRRRRRWARDELSRISAAVRTWVSLVFVPPACCIRRSASNDDPSHAIQSCVDA